MTIFNCKSMRAAVIVSAVLMVVGLLLLAPVFLFQEQTPFPFMQLVYPGFAAMILSPIVLLIAAAVSMVPSVNARLHNCQH